VPCKTCQKAVAENIAGQNQGFCHFCFEKHLREERAAAREKGEEALPVFFTKDCKIGICDRLKQHHANLVDDPERLTTDFMVGLICGVEGQEDYRELKRERMHGT
jgi:glutaredoxin